MAKRNCIDCEIRLDGPFYGAGDGTGQKFRCERCHWRAEITVLEASIKKYQEDNGELTIRLLEGGPAPMERAHALIRLNGTLVALRHLMEATGKLSIQDGDDGLCWCRTIDEEHSEVCDCVREAMVKARTTYGAVVKDGERGAGGSA